MVLEWWVGSETVVWGLKMLAGEWLEGGGDSLLEDCPRPMEQLYLCRVVKPVQRTP